MRAFGVSFFRMAQKYSRHFAVCLAVILFSFAAPAATTLHFPQHDGYVTDDAHVLSAQTIRALDEKLAWFEQETTDQLVVVTVSGLQGVQIQDYAYQLGRAWGVGQKGKNNGVVFLLAPKEHQVWISVGYGLEATLTDAASAEIVQGIVLPAFRQGDMERGVVRGTQAILTVLGGEGLPEATAANHQAPSSPLSNALAIIFLILFLCFAARHPFIAMMLLSNASRSGGGDSGWSGSSYSGGGGSFGGGGAGGSW